MKIGYQGIGGAYSEVALYNYFGHDVETVGFPLFEKVFAALKQGTITYAVLPVENTIAGSVGINYDLLFREDVFAIGDIYLPIQHTLLSHPGNTFSRVRRVYSHPVALSQCREFLNKHNIIPVPEYDTAGAAKIISEYRDMEEGAIASELCAEKYKLIVLDRQIQSNRENITRFFVIAKSTMLPKNLIMEKSSIVFSTHHHPGALVKCLEVLAYHNLNLSKLESRPIPENPFQYRFFVDFDGGITDESVLSALQILKKDCRELKILGSYPRGKLVRMPAEYKMISTNACEIAR
ncbi:prephenate dehydratase [Candidatus Riflebacteria bacterium]